MIIIGYQGIGKSTLASRDKKYLDLESSCFWVDGRRPDDWYKYYCQMAVHLSKQGYVVFTSSHQVVREWFILNRPFDLVLTCAPAPELQLDWITKLAARFANSNLDKDYKAWINAREDYQTNTQCILEDGDRLDGRIVIETIDYNLKDLILKAEEKINGKIRV